MEGPADSLEFIPDVPGMCKRNAWHLRVLRKLPSHPTHTTLPSRLRSAVLSLTVWKPLLTFFQTLHLFPSSLFPSLGPPNPLPAEFPRNKLAGLITELTFLDLRYNFSPGISVTGGVCPGS